MHDLPPVINPGKTSVVHIVLASRESHLLDKDGNIYFSVGDGLIYRYVVTDLRVKTEYQTRHGDTLAWRRKETKSTVALYDELAESGEMRHTFDRLNQ